METVRDLAETDIISVLHTVTVAHLKHTKSMSPPDVDAMRTDTAPVQAQDTSSLEEYLGRCVSYDTSASALRLALRKQLGDVEESMAVLQVLESWMRKWGKVEDELGVFAAHLPLSKDGSTQQLPELSKVLAYTWNVNTNLTNPLYRLYRSSKRCWTPRYFPSSNTLQPIRSFVPSPIKSSQSSSSPMKLNS